ncbi:hypothetical protein Scep_001668 [Stephania cephalantha]|uniref:Uncharacterized protein n=1 Tax=Stephania cephalantha TaxID=152367 RepID=A0AAP0Q3K6_9MAGN
MKPSSRYCPAALHSIKHKNDEPKCEINLTSIASSRFRRNRASDRSITRHRAVYRIAATSSLVGRRRRRSPAAAAGEFLRVASHRVAAVDPTRCRTVAAGVTAVTLPAPRLADRCSLPLVRSRCQSAASLLHCWPAAASRRRAGESPNLLCRRAGVTESPTTERHRALPRSRVSARPSVLPSTLPP